MDTSDGAKLTADRHGMQLRRCTILIAVCLAVANPRSVFAQSSAKIDVVSVFVVEPQSDAPLNIQVGPPDALPKNAFVRIRGVPQRVILTEGYQVAVGVWAVPLFGLAALKARIPKDASGRSELQVSLVGVDGTVIAEAKTALLIGQMNVGPPAEPPKAVESLPLQPIAPPVPAGRPDRTAKADASAGLAPRPAASEPQPPATAAPSFSTETRLRLEKLVQQGDKSLSQGSISMARQFYLRAADAGLGLAALKLAGTYDPAVLAGLAVQGMSPDTNEARFWYARARDLGEMAAAEALKRLNGTK
jgi:hypothetical protein